MVKNMVQISKDLGSKKFTKRFPNGVPQEIVDYFDEAQMDEGVIKKLLNDTSFTVYRVIGKEISSGIHKIGDKPPYEINEHYIILEDLAASKYRKFFVGKSLYDAVEFGWYFTRSRDKFGIVWINLIYSNEQEYYPDDQNGAIAAVFGLAAEIYKNFINIKDIEDLHNIMVDSEELAEKLDELIEYFNKTKTKRIIEEVL
jgi:hypothetical protein